MQLDDIIKNRRSIRKFNIRKIGIKTINKIVEAGTYAPSACNLQKWHFIVVDNDSVKERMCSLANSPNTIKNSAFTVIALYDKNTTPKDYANIQSAAAAIQNMLLKAYSMGIGSVWMCEYGDREKVKEILKIPENFVQIAAVAFGYPGESPTIPTRRSGVISYNSFNSSVTGNYPNSFNPDDWTMEQIRDYHSFKIRAKSPISDIHKPDAITLEIVKEIEPIVGRVLDVFPYYANYTYALLDAGKIQDLSIFEMSEEVINFLKWKFQPFKIKTKAIKGISRIPASNESFDAVTCLGGLDMIPNPERIISEIHRVLKKGGVLYLIFSNKNSVFGLYFKYRMLRSFSLAIPFRPLSYSRIMNDLKDGFKMEKIVGITLLSKPRLERIKFTGPMKRFCKYILVKATKI